MAPSIDYIKAEWPAPANVRAVSTLRSGGVSVAPYDSLNLGHHVGDAAEAVAENRRRVRETLALPNEPVWLNQVHGVDVVSAQGAPGIPCADASVVDAVGTVAAVLTADCLPVVLCDRRGTRAAVAHAGWRGLLAGILERTVSSMHTERGELLAWLGPAIGPGAFEVGTEVRDAFVSADARAADAFTQNTRGRWQANLYALARQRLAAAGVTAVYGGAFCTYSDERRFFSYRRDGETGRMATLAWLESAG